MHIPLISPMNSNIKLEYLINVVISMFLHRKSDFTLIVMNILKCFQAIQTVQNIMLP